MVAGDSMCCHADSPFRKDKINPKEDRCSVISKWHSSIRSSRKRHFFCSDMHKWHFYVRTCINCIFLFGQSLKWHLLFGHPCSVKPCVASIFGKDKNL